MTTGTETTRLELTLPSSYGPAEYRFGPVWGYVYRRGRKLYCPMVISKQPGRGWGGRAIEALEKLAEETDLQLVFANLLGPVLEGMLKRRGYRRGLEWADELGEHVDVWSKEVAG